MSTQSKYFPKDSLQIRGLFCLLELGRGRGGGFFSKHSPPPPPSIQSSENGNGKCRNTGSLLHVLLGWADVRPCKDVTPGSPDLRPEEGGTGHVVGERGLYYNQTAGCGFLFSQTNK